MGGVVTIISGTEIAVERGNDRILFSLFDIITFPLADTGTAGISQNNATGPRQGI
jgi:hypothetical protein